MEIGLEKTWLTGQERDSLVFTRQCFGVVGVSVSCDNCLRSWQPCWATCPPTPIIPHPANCGDTMAIWGCILIYPPPYSRRTAPQPICRNRVPMSPNAPFSASLDCAVRTRGVFFSSMSLGRRWIKLILLFNIASLFSATIEVAFHGSAQNIVAQGRLQG